MENRKMEK